MSGDNGEPNGDGMTSAGVTMTVRIPGRWSSPADLVEGLPPGFAVDEIGLKDPNGQTFEMFPIAPDDQFPGVFEGALRRPAEDAELEAVRGYSVAIVVQGGAGSLAACRQTARAAAAVVGAGGAGVFLDNSGLAFGGADWLAMAADGKAEAMSFACVSIVQDDRDALTLGMHLLGRPDLVITAGPDAAALAEATPLLCEDDADAAPGQKVFAAGRTWRLAAAEPAEFPADSPMHNPWGRVRLENAESE